VRGSVNCGQENILKDKTANQLADALVKMLESNHLSAEEVLGAMLGAPIPAKYKNLVEIGYKAGLKHKYKSLPEPDKDKLAEALAVIAAFKSAPQRFRTLIKARIKELPHGAGGAPRKVKLEEERTVCAEIQALKANLDTRDAIRQVARKRRVSERTIYRVWAKYYPKKKKSLT
jgi:hypothetical protein